VHSPGDPSPFEVGRIDRPSPTHAVAYGPLPRCGLGDLLNAPANPIAHARSLPTGLSRKIALPPLLTGRHLLAHAKLTEYPPDAHWANADYDSVVLHVFFERGAAPGDPYHAAPPPAPYAELARRPPRRLRIGFSTASPIGTPVHAEAVAAVRHTAALLERLGHRVEEAAPAIDGHALARAYLFLYFGQVPATVAQACAQGARPGDFELLTRVMAVLGQTVPAGALTMQLLQWNVFARALGAFHQQHDLWLTPTLAGPPLPHGATDPPPAQQTALKFLLGTGLLGLLGRSGALKATIDQIALENLAHFPFTQLSNLTGVPAMSVPLHWTAEGLPLGVQFVAPMGDETTLLQLATELESAQPWFERLAPMAHQG